MPSQGSITKTIRLNAEDREIIEQIMEGEGVSWSGAIHKLITESVPRKKEGSSGGCTPKKEEGDVHQIMSEETRADLEQMCRVSGLTLGRFMEYIRVLFNDGKIYVDGLTVKTRGDYDLRYLVDVCHRLNIDPQEMINKLANSLVRR